MILVGMNNSWRKEVHPLQRTSLKQLGYIIIRCMFLIQHYHPYHADFV